MSDDALNRRWLRFSLATVFVVLTAFTCWLGWNLYRVKERQRVRQEIGWRGARLYTPGFLAQGDRHKPTGQHALPAIWSLLGAEPLGSIELPAQEFGEDERLHIQSLFPEADVSIPRVPPGMGQGIM